MDPKACLTQADQAIGDCDDVTARYCLNEYAKWRAKGGFEPFEVAGSLQRGDAFAKECERRLESLLHQRQAEYERGLYLDTGPQAWDDRGPSED